MKRLIKKVIEKTKEAHCGKNGNEHCGGLVEGQVDESSNNSSNHCGHCG